MAEISTSIRILTDKLVAEFAENINNYIIEQITMSKIMFLESSKD